MVLLQPLEDRRPIVPGRSMLHFRELSCSREQLSQKGSIASGVGS